MINTSDTVLLPTDFYETMGLSTDLHSLETKCQWFSQSCGNNITIQLEAIGLSRFGLTKIPGIALLSIDLQEAMGKVQFLWFRMTTMIDIALLSTDLHEAICFSCFLVAKTSDIAMLQTGLQEGGVHHTDMEQKVYTSNRQQEQLLWGLKH